MIDSPASVAGVTMSSAGNAVLSQLKGVARKQLKAALKAIPSTDRTERSKLLVKKLIATPEYQESHRISVYLSMVDEVETRTLLDDMFAVGKKCFVPRFQGSDMEMLALSSLDDLEALPSTMWDIKQPAMGDTKRENALDTGGLDLIVVPGLGFTMSGHRLGRGKGIYDRYLLRCANLADSQNGGRRPRLVAMAFSEQILPEIPVSETDFVIDRIITE